MSKKRRDSRMGDRTGKTAEDRDQGYGSNILNLPEGTEFFELAKRKNINIIPYPVTISNHPDKKDGFPDKGDVWWRKPILVHKNIGVQNNTYICPTTIGKPCPICEEVDLLRQEYKKNEKIIGGIRAKKRDLFVVEDADDTKAGVKLFDISYHLFTKLLLKEIDEGPDEYKYFAEPQDGLTVACRFEEETYQGKPFFKIDRIDFEKRDDYAPKLLKKALELDEILNVESYDDLKTAFLQLDESSLPSSDDDTEDAEPEEVEPKEPEEVEAEDADPEEEKEETPKPETESLVGKSVKYIPDGPDGEVCRVIEHDMDTGILEIEDPTGTVFDEIDVKDVEEEEGAGEEAEKEEAPAPSSRRSKKESSDDTCPFGHTWAEDCGAKKECKNKCEDDTWEKCKEAKEALDE